MHIKKLINAGLKYITDSDYRFLINSGLGKYNSMGDKQYLEKKFKATVKRQLDLDNPKGFNEKLQYLKLYDKNPVYTVMADKYLVRDYISEKLGEEYLIPLLGVWDNPEDIDFSSLPSQFVLKCNHNSGTGMCICKNKDNLNIEKVKNDLKKGLNEDYFLTGREWPYKNIPRKIICEKYMTDNENADELSDYKFMCFDGKVKCIFTCTDRFDCGGLKVTFFDKEWNKLPFTRSYPASEKNIPQPVNLNKMIELAEVLSKDIPFVRVDFYEISGKIYFGELTFFPGSGFEAFQPYEYDEKLGSYINLPPKN